MAVVFAVRGDSFDARYSSNGKSPGKHQRNSSDPALLTVTTETGCIGTSLINLAESSTLTTRTRGISYVGRNNWVATQNWSILLRCAPQWTGVNPGTNRGIFHIKTSGSFNGYVEMGIQTDGNFEIGMANETSSSVPFLAGTYAYSPTANTINDIVLTFDGTDCKVYTDATLRDTITMASPLYSAARDPLKIDSIFIGTGATRAVTADIKVEEFVIWNEVITPSSVTLTSGSGSLNGASRTSFVDVASFDGLSNTDPGEANVVSGTAYVIAGVAKTGSSESIVIADLNSAVDEIIAQVKLSRYL